MNKNETSPKQKEIKDDKEKKIITKKKKIGSVIPNDEFIII